MVRHKAFWDSWPEVDWASTVRAQDIKPENFMLLWMQEEGVNWHFVLCLGPWEWQYSVDLPFSFSITLDRYHYQLCQLSILSLFSKGT